MPDISSIKLNGIKYDLNDKTAHSALQAMQEKFGNAENIMFMLGSDGVIQTVISGMTEKITFTNPSLYAFCGYKVYAGDTLLSENSLSMSDSFTTAYSAFDSGELTAALLRTDGTEAVRAAIKVVEHGGVKYVKLVVVG